ncbi:hypothetical protein HY992_00415 [Candidatus Micrarchaeota archaeon]|nr:hypothetical protein [Candidatus Micrarchaeota archaeon]
MSSRSNFQSDELELVRVKWIEDLKNGVVNVEVLLGLDAFEREHEQDSLELGKTKVSGKHDSQLEEKVKQQLELAKQLEELKKKHGIKTKQDEKKEEQLKQLEEEDKKIKEMREEKSKDKIENFVLFVNENRSSNLQSRNEQAEKLKREANALQTESEQLQKNTQEEKQQAETQAVKTTEAKQEEKKEVPAPQTINAQDASRTIQQIQPANVQTEVQATTPAQPTQTAASTQTLQPEKKEIQSAPTPIVKVIMPEEKERDEIPPEGFVYKLVQGRRIELVRIQDEQQFNENEKKVNAANQELQKARIRGERTKARELEQVISDGIDVREAIVQKAKEAQK